MELEVVSKRNVSVVRLSGRLAFASGDVLLRRRFRELVDAGGRFFVIDMTELEWMDSAGVGELVACAKRAYEAGGVIKIVAAPRGKVREILELTGLERVFEIHDSAEAALSSFP